MLELIPASIAMIIIAYGAWNFTMRHFVTAAASGTAIVVGMLTTRGWRRRWRTWPVALRGDLLAAMKAAEDGRMRVNREEGVLLMGGKARSGSVLLVYGEREYAHARETGGTCVFTAFLLVRPDARVRRHMDIQYFAAGAPQPCKRTRAQKWATLREAASERAAQRDATPEEIRRVIRQLEGAEVLPPPG
jgi:hypothetical protein